MFEGKDCILAYSVLLLIDGTIYSVFEGSGAMRFTEEKLKSFEAPLSETEDQKCKNAIGMVRDALKAFGFNEGTDYIKRAFTDTYDYSVNMRNTQTNKEVKLLVQGSYANNTNVRSESDVDVAVILESTFMADYPIGVTRESYNFTASDYHIWTFKDDVEKMLNDYFKTGVERKNKSIKIHGNSYRVDADTVPCMRNKDFRSDYSRTGYNISGIYIRADDGTTVVNYPEQHIANGRKKNTDTNLYYKKMVRVVKKMRYLMQENNIEEANKVSSFALESLLWNIPNDVYLENSRYTHCYLFSQLLLFILKDAVAGKFTNYKEANGIKVLFPNSNDITNMTNFISKLVDFFEWT